MGGVIPLAGAPALRGATGVAVARPPLALERLGRDGDGLVVHRLKRPFRDGTTEFVFEPLDFLARLAALVPRPRSHLLRYHGVLAANARHRRLVVPAPAPAAGGADDEPVSARGRTPMSWMQRLRYMFDIMILIDNATQSGLLTIPECIDALERAFGAIDSGQAIYRPKTDVNVPNSKMNEYYRFGSMEGWFDAIFRHSLHVGGDRV